MDYLNKHVIVTGGSSGIGRALVRRLADRGARVSIVALADADLESVMAEHANCTASVTAHGADVGVEAEIQSAVAAAVDEHGPCDLLVTSAGIARPGHFLELDSDQFDRQMQVNYFGTLYAIRAVAPAMVAARRGSIVAISSAAGLLGVFGYSAYGPTKYAVRGLCDILRTELKPHGIYLACVFPADVDTPQFAGEQPYLPAETRAIAGTVKPISADKAAAAILRGIDKRRTYIFTDPATAVIERVARWSPGITRRLLDRRVSGVAQRV